MRWNQFQRNENRRVWSQAHRRQILAGKVQLDGLLQVATDLVERQSLGDDWDLETLSHIAALLSGSDHGLDRALKHRYLLPVIAIKWARKYDCRQSTERSAGIARNSLLRCLRRKARTPHLAPDKSGDFDLVIILKTAKALGLRFPQSLLNRADEVIQ